MSADKNPLFGYGDNSPYIEGKFEVKETIIIPGASHMPARTYTEHGGSAIEVIAMRGAEAVDKIVQEVLGFSLTGAEVLSIEADIRGVVRLAIAEEAEDRDAK